MGQVGGPASAAEETACSCGDKSISVDLAALQNTLNELAAIRSTAEDAATRILESAEGLLAGKDDAAKAEDAILSIMTACGFHDLVGQRVAKITETLGRIIATNGGGEVPGTAGHDIVLEGPALPGTGQDQAEIDALFEDRR